MVPEVSVVMAVHNDAAGFDLAARSVLDQHDIPLELVAIDDGSTDGTRDSIAAMAAEDERVRAMYLPRAGLTAALVRGCAEARAPLVARQDAGDTSEPTRLRKQVALLEANPEVVFVSCWTRCLGPAGEELQLVTGLRTDASSVHLDPSSDRASETVGPSSHGSVLFRKVAYERAEGYRMPFRLAQDWDLWWRLAEVGRFASVPEALYTRTLRPTSLSLSFRELQREYGELARRAANLRRRGESEGATLRQAEALARRLEGARSRRRSVSPGLYFIGSLLRAQGDRRARDYFARAARENPLFLRAWVRWFQSR